MAWVLLHIAWALLPLPSHASFRTRDPSELTLVEPIEGAQVKLRAGRGQLEKVTRDLTSVQTGVDDLVRSVDHLNVAMDMRGMAARHAYVDGSNAGLQAELEVLQRHLLEVDRELQTAQKRAANKSMAREQEERTREQRSRAREAKLELENATVSHAMAEAQKQEDLGKRNLFETHRFCVECHKEVTDIQRRISEVLRSSRNGTLVAVRGQARVAAMAGRQRLKAEGTVIRAQIQEVESQAVAVAAKIRQERLRERELLQYADKRLETMQEINATRKKIAGLRQAIGKVGTANTDRLESLSRKLETYRDGGRFATLQGENYAISQELHRASMWLESSLYGVRPRGTLGEFDQNPSSAVRHVTSDELAMERRSHIAELCSSDWLKLERDSSSRLEECKRMDKELQHQQEKLEHWTQARTAT